jgi:hypothetical protein
MAESASATRTRFAGPFPVFNPQGDINTETATIYALTLLCMEGDIRPSDVGYRVIADEVWDVSDYVRSSGEAARQPTPTREPTTIAIGADGDLRTLGLA